MRHRNRAVDRVGGALVQAGIDHFDRLEQDALHHIHRLRSRYSARTRFGRWIRTLSIPDGMGRCLFALVRALRPKTCLELGTGVGISAAYITAALAMNGKGSLWTLDRDADRLTLARQHLRLLPWRVPCHFVQGPFSRTFGKTLQELGAIDFGFIDDEHTVQAVRRRLPKLLKALRPGGILVYDDLPWSPHTVLSWRHIQRSRAVGLALDCGRFGIVLPEVHGGR